MTIKPRTQIDFMRWRTVSMVLSTLINLLLK